LLRSSGAAAYFGHPLVGALLFIDELALKVRALR